MRHPPIQRPGFLAIGGADDGHEAGLERAAEQALELRATVDALQDPVLLDLVNAVLMEIGIALADELRRRHQ